MNLAAPSAFQCGVGFFEEAHVLLDVVTLFEKGLRIPLASFGVEEISAIHVDGACEAPDRISHRVDDVMAEGFGIPRAEGFGPCGFELARPIRNRRNPIAAPASSLAIQRFLR